MNEETTTYIVDVFKRYPTADEGYEVDPGSGLILPDLSLEYQSPMQLAEAIKALVDAEESYTYLIYKCIP